MSLCMLCVGCLPSMRVQQLVTVYVCWLVGRVVLCCVVVHTYHSSCCVGESEVTGLLVSGCGGLHGSQAAAVSRYPGCSPSIPITPVAVLCCVVGSTVLVWGLGPLLPSLCGYRLWRGCHTPHMMCSALCPITSLSLSLCHRCRCIPHGSHCDRW